VRAFHPLLFRSNQRPYLDPSRRIYRREALHVLTRAKMPAVLLQHVQMEPAGKNLSLIVWDCYRPLRVVRDFIDWNRSQQRPLMKAEFFLSTTPLPMFN
jgi:D-alanyl-D-alanine dipeptidase